MTEEFETNTAEQTDVPVTPQEETKTEATSAQGAPEVSEGAAFFKSELEKAQKKLSQAEFKLTQQNLEAKKRKDDDDDDDEDVSEINSRIASLEQTLSERLSNFETSQKEQALSGFNADDRAEIEFHLANSVKQTGDINKDIQLAARLATAKRSEAVAGEMKQAFTNRPAAGSTQGVRVNDSAPLPIDDAAIKQLRDLGLTDDEIREAVGK